MSVDLATLGIAVDSTQVLRGTQALQEFAITGANAANAAKILGANSNATVPQLQRMADVQIAATMAAKGLTEQEAALSLGLLIAAASSTEYAARVDRLLASLSPLIAAEQRHDNALIETNALYAAGALSTEGYATAQLLAAQNFDKIATSIAGTSQNLKALKAAQEGTNFQNSLSMAFPGLGGDAEKSAKESAAIFQAAFLADELAAKNAAKGIQEITKALEELNAIKAAQNAIGAQQDFNSFMGVGAPVTNSAKASASAMSDAFKEQELAEKAAREETEKLAKAQVGVTVSSMQMRAGLGAIKDVIEGRDTMAAGSFMTLIQRTFGPEALLYAAGVAAIAAPLVGLVYYIEQGADQFAHLSDELQITGNYAGTTAAKLQTLGQTISDRFNVPVGNVNKTLVELASTGAFTSQTMQLMTEDAVSLSKFTGESADKIAVAFEKMKDGVTKYALEFNSQYHFLDAAEIAHIQRLEEQGKESEAAFEFEKDRYTWLGQQAPAQLGFLDSAWKAIQTTTSQVLQNIRNIGAPPSLTSQMADKRSDIAYDEEQQGLARSQNNSAALVATTAQLRSDTKDLLGMIGQVNSGNVTSNAAQDRQAGVNAYEKVKASIDSIKDSAELAKEKVADFNSQMALAFKGGASKTDPTVYDPNDPANATRLKHDDDLISRKYDREAFKKGPTGEAQVDKYSDDTAKVNAHADALLREASAYDTSTYAGMAAKAAADAHASAVAADIKAAHSRIGGGNVSDADINAQAQANLHLATATAIADDTKYAQGIIAKADAQIQANTLVKAGAVAQADANRVVEEAIRLNNETSILASGGRDEVAGAIDAIVALSEAQQKRNQADDGTKSNDRQEKYNLELEAMKEKATLLVQETALIGNNSRAVAIAIAYQEEYTKAIKEKYSPVQAASLANQAGIVGGNEWDKSSNSNQNQQAQTNNALAAQYEMWQKNQITVTQYNLALEKTVQTQLQLKAAMSGNFSDTFIANLHSWANTGKTTSQQLGEDYSKFFTNFEDGFANSVGKAVVEGKNFGSMLHQVAVSGAEELISALVKMGEQWVINQVLGQSLQAASTAAGVANAAALAAAWEPAAVAASIASFGAADAAAIAGMSAASAAGALSLLIPGHSVGGPISGPGGPTGDGILGRLSDGEYVIKASAAKNNRPLLDAINSGKQGFAAGGAVNAYAGVSSTPNTNVGGMLFDFRGSNFGGADPATIEARFRQVMVSEYGPAIVQQSVAATLAITGKQATRQKLNVKPQ